MYRVESHFFTARACCLKAHLQCHYDAVAAHPTNKNAVICFDLSADPEILINLNSDDIKQRIFTATKDLPEGVDRIALKLVHLNKAPMVATPKVVDATVAKRLSIDVQRCEQNWQRLQQVDLQHKFKQYLPIQNLLLATRWNSNYMAVFCLIRISLY